MSDFGQMEQKFDRNGGQVQFGSDERLFVYFYDKPTLDEVQSREAGRPINVNVVHVVIRQPGERDEINRPAHRGDQQRFGRHWAAYQEGRQELPAGTPLSILFPNNPEVVENLKYDKIFVVEQLAALNDTQIGNIGLGGRQFVDKAKTFLAAASNGKGLQEMFAEIDQMAANIKALEKKNEALETALEKANKKRGQEAA